MKNIYDVAARRIGSGRRTRQDLYQWLSGKGFPEEEIEELLDEFTEDGYLNDRLYSQDYFAYAFNKGWAKKRACYELSKKGISSEDIEGGFADYIEFNDLDEKQNAYEIIQQDLRESDLDGSSITDKAKARLGRKLNSYGYDAYIIYDVIEMLDSQIQDSKKDCKLNL